MNPQLRPRSTAAMVLSRADPHPSAAAAEPPPPPPARAGRGWVGVVKWGVLGALIAALWALLLLGDSLRPVAG